MNNFSGDLSTVGRHFFVGLQKSASLTDHDVRLLATLKPAGIILFRENFQRGVPYAEWLPSYRELIARVRESMDGQKLLISIDHEGGLVFRSPPPITNFGAAATWASRSSEVGSAMGVELRSLGVNLDYAPVVDIHTNPANPVIGNRAFGTDAEIVAKSAADFLAALERENVIACPKHFPGHGDTSVDSHYGLPVVHRTIEELRQRELLPFAAMIRAGTKIIMSAHILYPAIDPDFPVTLSPRWLNGVLRGQLGFQGAITTDDIGMGAVSTLFNAPGAAIRALQSGCDLLMMSAHWTNTNRVLGLAQDLLDGLNSGKLDRKVFEESQTRINRLLDAAPVHAVEPLPEDVLAAHDSLRARIAEAA
jgi:beta-N-acetylhexosaminidase